MTTSLAPGFRFHPTDEELVSYYLKRKVLSKPLRVDAISEIDLYKSEPWDLPEKSRIRSRDVEWYFFSRLDKKYSNRSRTNRTTGHGYWKTTGKDRPVKKGTRIVGMKKTLVFHSGRAPKGKRTNWVMHEYRLEDEELAKDVQDGYVVCRIFQKSGAGPQNGAQYGAPFVEEEWENDDADVMVVVSGEEMASGSGEPQRALSEDLVQESKIVDLKTENHHGPLEVPHGVDNAPNSLSNVVHPGVPSICPVEVYQHQQLLHLGNQNVSTPQVHDSQTLVESEDNFAMSAWPVGVPNDDYLELNDFSNSFVREAFIRTRNDQVFSSVSDQPANLMELGGVEEFFNSTNEIVQQTSEADVAYADNFCLEMDGENPFTNEYASGENSMMPYHAPDDNLQFEYDCFFEPNEFLDPPDKIDDLLAYFDATEDDLQHSYLENSGINSCALGSSHVDRELAENKVQLQDSVARGGAEASAKMPGDEDEKPSQKVEYPVKPGSAPEDWEKTITGRLVGFLGSISSPPALAAEYPRREGKAVDFNSAAQPSSSVHVTAGIIRIDGLTMRKDESQWPVQKTEDVSFLLSYSMAKADSASNLGKMHCNAISMMIRSGFCLSLFSILCLALSYKIGICICAR